MDENDTFDKNDKYKKKDKNSNNISEFSYAFNPAAIFSCHDFSKLIYPPELKLNKKIEPLPTNKRTKFNMDSMKETIHQTLNNSKLSSRNFKIRDRPNLVYTDKYLDFLPKLKSQYSKFELNQYNDELVEWINQRQDSTDNTQDLLLKQNIHEICLLLEKFVKNQTLYDKLVEISHVLSETNRSLIDKNKNAIFGLIEALVLFSKSEIKNMEILSKNTSMSDLNEQSNFLVPCFCLSNLIILNLFNLKCFEMKNEHVNFSQIFLNVIDFLSLHFTLEKKSGKIEINAKYVEIYESVFIIILKFLKINPNQIMHDELTNKAWYFFANVIFDNIIDTFSFTSLEIMMNLYRKTDDKKNYLKYILNEIKPIFFEKNFCIYAISKDDSISIYSVLIFYCIQATVGFNDGNALEMSKLHYFMVQFESFQQDSLNFEKLQSIVQFFCNNLVDRLKSSNFSVQFINLLIDLSKTLYHVNFPISWKICQVVVDLLLNLLINESESFLLKLTCMEALNLLLPIFFRHKVDNYFIYDNVLLILNTLLQKKSFGYENAIIYYILCQLHNFYLDEFVKSDIDPENIENFKLSIDQKESLITLVCDFSKISSLDFNSPSLNIVDHKSIISNIFFSTHRNYNSENIINCIIRLMSNTNIRLRTMAMKIFSVIIDKYPELINLNLIECALSSKSRDKSVHVRECTVDIIGNLFSKSVLPNAYFNIFQDRITDRAVSVRKKVLSHVKQFCIKNPSSQLLSKIISTLLENFNFDETIQPMILEIIEILWFTLNIDQNLDEMMRIVNQILVFYDKVVDDSANSSFVETFAFIFTEILKKKREIAFKVENNLKSSKWSNKPALFSFWEIFKFLVDEIVVKIFNIPKDNMNFVDMSKLEPNFVNLIRKLPVTFAILNIMSQLMPVWFVEHLDYFQSFMKIRFGDNLGTITVYNVIKIIQNVVPFIEHPNSCFVHHLLHDLVKLSFSRGKCVLISSIECLGQVVRYMSKDYSAIEKIFKKCFNVVVRYSKSDLNGLSDNIKTELMRSVYTLGLLTKHFDLQDISSNVKTSLLKKMVFDNLMLLCSQQNNVDVRKIALYGLGGFVNRYIDHFNLESIRKLYINCLTFHEIDNLNSAKIVKIMEQNSQDVNCAVLDNIKEILIICTSTSEERDKIIPPSIKKNQKIEQKAIICKELESYSSDTYQMVIETIVQTYLSIISKVVITSNDEIRKKCFDIFSNLWISGMVYPSKVLPLFLAMLTDLDENTRTKSTKLVCDAYKKYPNINPSDIASALQISCKLKLLIENNNVPTFVKYCEISRLNLSTLFTIHKSKKSRQVVINLISSTLENTQDVDYKIFVLEIFVYLQISYIEDVVAILFKLDNLSNAPSLTMVDTMGKCYFDDSYDFNTDAIFLKDISGKCKRNINDMITLIQDSQFILIIFLVKQYLLNSFGLNDKKCHQFYDNYRDNTKFPQTNRLEVFASYEQYKSFENITHLIKSKVNQDNKASQTIVDKYIVKFINFVTNFQKNIILPPNDVISYKNFIKPIEM
ncbi:hypothetical protein A3Q56_01709 [Intoshia linei]|uniref:Nipped-B protein n=1 Tax=Intoshia linei TaxID=1819745 RepID=A0A177B8A0_9BILA|nr:hypothetical protein A3Q56_01709 [Intoshia linei]